jgi:hypothetical protein
MEIRHFKQIFVMENKVSVTVTNDKVQQLVMLSTMNRFDFN